MIGPYTRHAYVIHCRPEELAELAEHLLTGEYASTTVRNFVEDFQNLIPGEDWELFPKIMKLLKPEKPENADSDEDTTGGKRKATPVKKNENQTTPVKKKPKNKATPVKKKTKNKPTPVKKKPKNQATPVKKKPKKTILRRSPRLTPTKEAKMVTPAVQKTKSIGFSKGAEALHNKEFRECFKSPEGRPRRVPKKTFKAINMDKVAINPEEFAKTEEWMTTIKSLPEEKLKDTYKSIFTYRDAERLIAHDFLPDSIVYRMAMHFKKLFRSSRVVVILLSFKCHSTIINMSCTCRSTITHAPPVMHVSLTCH